MGLNDEADEGRRRDETAAELRAELESLAGIQDRWIEMLQLTDPVTNERQLAALAHRVAELVEMTSVAEQAHPSERPLRPFLEACPLVAGVWELDTRGPLMQLMGVMLRLPPLPLPTHEDGTRAAIDAWVELQLPLDFGAFDAVRVERHGQDGVRSMEHSVRLAAGALKDGIRTHLMDAITTSTVLARSSTDWGIPPMRKPKQDDDVDAARTADRLLDLFAGLEHALARRDSSGRGPDGATPADDEVANRRRMLFHRVFTVEVTVRQELPLNTLEPLRLRIEADTGQDPDGLDVLPTSFRLEIDLSVEHRGAGILRVGDWSGEAERAVLLPRVADLWSEHIESAMARTDIVMPGVRRRPVDEKASPVPSVGPPSAEDQDLRALLEDVPF
jgi:hypothetical protein